MFVQFTLTCVKAAVILLVGLGGQTLVANTRTYAWTDKSHVLDAQFRIQSHSCSLIPNS